MPMIPKNIQLVTDRLILRAASIADVDLIWSASRVPGFTKDMTWEPADDKAEIEEIAAKTDREWAQDEQYTFTVKLRESGQGVGRFAIRRSEQPDVWDIGYWIHPEHWSQGYATEAGKAILEFGASELAATKITVAHAIGNKASQRVIEKLGFVRTGETPCGFTKHGKPVPEYLYEITCKAD